MVHCSPQFTTFYSYSPEQAMVFAEPESPVLLTGGFYPVSAVYSDEAKLPAL